MTQGQIFSLVLTVIAIAIAVCVIWGMQGFIFLYGGVACCVVLWLVWRLCGEYATK